MPVIVSHHKLECFLTQQQVTDTRRNWPDAKDTRREERSWQRAKHVQRPSVRTARHGQDDKTMGWIPEVWATAGKTRPKRQTTEGLVCYVLELWLTEENMVRAEGAGR